MSEPKLEDIGDYDTLKGEKKRVVIAVVLATLLMGTIYSIAYNVYGQPDDRIEVQESFQQIPVK